MGLGKTFSTLATLDLMASAGMGPFLVIAPTTLVNTWVREAQRWLPHRPKPYVYHGGHNERRQAASEFLNSDEPVQVIIQKPAFSSDVSGDFLVCVRHDVRIA